MTISELPAYKRKGPSRAAMQGIIFDADIDEKHGDKFFTVHKKSIQCWNGKKYINAGALAIDVPTGMCIDHIDGNKFNNQRTNLRVVTYQQNAQNKCIQSNNLSGYVGVDWRKDRQMWRVRLKLLGQELHIGHFTVLADAVAARDAAARIHYREFGVYNEPLLNEQSAHR